MSGMPIITITEKKDENFLRKKTELFDFNAHSKKEIQELVTNMRKIMIAANGIGLAANQIGLKFRIFVARVPEANGKMKFYAIFNPKIERFSKDTKILSEGCLSVPGILGEVPRAGKVVLSGFDKFGKPIKIKAWGLLAHIFQHETDHLGGMLFIDKAKMLTSVDSSK
ncbi:MAG: peptide deformylase [bacterium]|nr:peptide deformylase [bacterium]